MTEARTAGDDLTPLMKQYYELKAQAEDSLLLFRMGDFYELFGEDAVTASRILEITLTSRDKNKPNPLPMCGVPHHSVQGYIQRLLKDGRKVAIAEQMEDPATVRPGSKNVVKREIIRFFTPAVQFDQEGSEATYLATAIRVEQTSSRANARDSSTWALACLDSSTGECIVGSALSSTSLANECLRLPIKHFLCFGDDMPEEARSILTSSNQILYENIPTNYLSPLQSAEILKTHYGVESLDAFVKNEYEARALGILVKYAIRSQRLERLAHLRRPAPLHRPRSMSMGPRTAQHLDLITAMDGSIGLYGLINRTRSALGARQLKRWILEPLKNQAEISERQEGTRELAEKPDLARGISTLTSEIYDLERISGRLNARLANPRDTLALGKSLAVLPRLIDALTGARSAYLKTLRDQLSTCAGALSPFAERVLRVQKADAPLTARDGGIFERGTSPELDRLLSLTEDGQKWLLELEQRERTRTGIPSLKVRYNRVFGYYIEVTQAHLKNVPAEYQRKQTTVGAERFFTEELKKFEDEIVNASAKQKALELDLFEELLTEALALTTPIMEAAKVIGDIDALNSLALLAFEPGWVFPRIDDSLDIEIESGRHPLVDKATNGAFVPNDILLSPSTRMALLITGPNMGGKSTIMRSLALIVILGQIGAPVPAMRARWGAVSSLHTRIGAHDAIARGQSTFMVEMTELAAILHDADDHSLIVLDEIGRGTSTYDGISVAWASLEWICNNLRSRTLFATHYHELTKLAGSTLPTLANAHMAVEGTRGQKSGNLRFLYKLREGPANESFGVHVARLAGLPTPVVTRAWKILEELENGSFAQETREEQFQLQLFNQPSSRIQINEDVPSSRIAISEDAPDAHSELRSESVHEQLEKEQAPDDAKTDALLAELREANIDELTPLRALNLLAGWKENFLQ